MPADQTTPTPAGDAPVALQVFGNNNNLSADEFLGLLSGDNFDNASPPEPDFDFDMAISPGSPGMVAQNLLHFGTGHGPLPNLALFPMSTPASVGTFLVFPPAAQTPAAAVPMAEEMAAASPITKEPAAATVAEEPMAASPAAAVPPAVENLDVALPAKVKLTGAAKIVEDRMERFLNAVRLDQGSIVTAMLAEYPGNDEFAPWHVKAYLDYGFGTVLHLAVEERNLSAVEALCNDPRVCRDLLNVFDMTWKTPLGRCVSHPRWYLNATLKALLDAGANAMVAEPNSSPATKGLSTLADAFQVMCNDADEELLTQLIKQFPPETIKDPVGFFGQTASASAVEAAQEHGNILPLRVLMDLDLLDTSGQMLFPLHVAAKCGSVKMAQLFLEKGAQKDLVRFCDGQAPLHVAANCGHVGVMELLVSVGADLQKVDDKGWTPLACAVANDCSHVIEYLREFDASFADRACRFRALNGQSLLDLAMEHGHPDRVVELSLMGVPAASTAGIRATPENCLEALNAAGRQRTEGDAPSVHVDSAAEPIFSDALMSDYPGSGDESGAAQDLASAVPAQDPTNTVPIAVTGALHGGVSSTQQATPASQTGSQRSVVETSDSLDVAGSSRGQASDFEESAHALRSHRHSPAQLNLDSRSSSDGHWGDDEDE
ncbi:hypothetical protein GGF32_009874 [Allomyces javanicus]|nr:hypothetical protein GGF32_009874 [Allomyces javanicus]